jgi:hypothetical protein
MVHGVVMVVDRLASHSSTTDGESGRRGQTKILRFLLLKLSFEHFNNYTTNTALYKKLSLAPVNFASRARDGLVTRRDASSVSARQHYVQLI